MAKTKIIVVGGPTGIGKTSTAICLAREFNGEIINADSMQVYRQMDVGTAKPTQAERDAAKHHLVDIIDPHEPFDAARFASAAAGKIEELAGKGIVPFVVGGTGLYIKALLYGLSRARPADPAVLAALKQEAREKGTETLHARLAACDPEAAGKIHPRDGFRIIRALEVYEKTGIPISSHHKRHGFSEARYAAFKICLHMERKALYDRIDKRVEFMIAAGLIEEVKRLLEDGYPANLKSMQAIGYRHVGEYLAGKADWKETLETLKRDTRRYAKRQLTWFRADPEVLWFEPTQIQEMTAEIGRFLNGPPAT